MPMSTFHPYHGENIRLFDNDIVAFRANSFAHALSFSEKALHPMEIFLIEIETNERGWSGHLRIGLTQHDPNKRFHLPQYALPDLINMGNSWIYAVTKSHNKVYEEDPTSMDNPKPYKSILGDGEFVHTYRGPFKKSILKPIKVLNSEEEDGTSGSPKSGSIQEPISSGESPEVEAQDCDNEILPTDEGSRIGIVYVVKNNKAEMHFIINGEDQGPCAKDIPYDEGPLYAVVDVYGTTKQVRIVQLVGVGTLQNSCREVILQRVKTHQIEGLPVPTKIKEYLRYEIS